MTRVYPLLAILFFIMIMLSTSPCLASQVQVRVLDGNAPVGGATVLVQLSGTCNAVTGPDGVAGFKLPDGRYTFIAVKEGYRDGKCEAEVLGNTSVLISLERLYSISGTVVDSGTGLPIEASIVVSDKVTQAVYAGSTDDNGVFSILVPNGYYGITVRAPLYHPAFRDNLGEGYHVLDNSLYVGYIPLVLSTDVSGNPEGVRLSTDYPGKRVKVNESIVFDIKIINNGPLDRTYSIMVKEAPPGWNVRLLSGSDEICQVYVESKASKTFKLETTPLEEGSHIITVMAGSANDNSSLQLFVNATQDKDYKMELDLPSNLTLDTGTNKNLEILVRNNGATKLTNIRLDVEDSEMLTTEVAGNVDEILPGDTARLTLRVYAKADATQGTQKLYLRAVSTETRTPQQYIEVTINKSNTWIGAGIAIAIIAILTFAYIVWKYGRR